MSLDFGVNVIGFVSGRLGLGVAARTTIAALVRCGVRTAAVDVQLSGNRSNADTTWQHLTVRDPAATGLPHPVNIVHVNPLEAVAIANQFPQFFDGRYNIIVPFYELPRVQQSWIPVLAEYDLVLAASSFIASAISRVSNVRVRQYAMGLQELGRPSGDSRARFNLDPRAFICVTAFDVNSGLNRKNPLGTIRAFDAAFAGRSDVQLVIKVNGTPRSAELCALFARLSRSPRYRIVDEYLAYPDLMALYDACDAYVSLHRAEGLGLGMMEAMHLGKAVIATGWSGNMDFMDETNSCPVNYTLTPVVDRNHEYDPLRVGEPCLWAEPDLQHAIMLLQRVAADEGYRARIGVEARTTVDERNALFYNGRFVRTIVENYLTATWEREQLAADEFAPA